MLKDRLHMSALEIVRGFRRVATGPRALPDFVIIGAQKCGTTSLYDHLCRHSQICSALLKEVHFFDDGFHRGVPWYRSNFPLCSKISRRQKHELHDVLTGESSPRYLFHPHAPARMAQVIPDARLIVLLRNPVERAYAHYQHNLRRRREPLSFEEAIRGEDARLAGELEKLLADETYFSFNYTHFSYVKRGIYVDQIEAFRRHFADDRILVLQSEDFFQNVQQNVDRVFEFLGVEPYALGDVRPQNVGNYAKEKLKDQSDLYDDLVDRFAPYNRRLYETLAVDFQW